ncbi:MAG: YdcF family protein [SAR324 cluster bacterium]|nr:YdcF family protein [SAR324 cluster bacterium]
MQNSMKLIIEDIIFGPLIWCILLILVAVWPFSSKETRIQSKYKVVLMLWVFLMICSSNGFYFLFSYPLRQMIPPNAKKHADAIIVASAGVYDSGAPSPGSTLRAHAAAQLYLEKRAPLVIVAGGVTEPYKPPVDTKGINIILKGMGVPEEHILIENQSVDTHMNGIETAKILNKLNLKTIILVSHDYHLPRLVAVFEKLGFEVYTFAANQAVLREYDPWWVYYFDWRNFNNLKTIAHEYMGLLSYKFMGRI